MRDLEWIWVKLADGSNMVKTLKPYGPDAKIKGEKNIQSTAISSRRTQFYMEVPGMMGFIKQVGWKSGYIFVHVCSNQHLRARASSIVVL